MEEFMANMSQLFTTVTQQLNTAGPSTSTMALAIPKFDPERDDLEEWLSEIDQIVADFKWTDREALVRVAPSLAGSAKRWFDNWHPNSRDWQCLKSDLSIAFPPKRNFALKLLDACLFRSEKSRTYAEYVREKHERIKRLRAGWSEAQVLDIIIHGIDDPIVRASIMSSNCKSIMELTNILSTVVKESNSRELIVKASHMDNLKRKRLSHHPENSSSGPRRCFKCGSPSHVISQCMSGSSRNIDTPNTFKNKPASTCTFCNRFGHLESTCWAKEKVTSQKKINVCSFTNATPTTRVAIQNTFLDSLLDTGSDCSLIKKNIAARFSGRRTAVFTTLQGLGTGSTFSSEQIVLQCEFEQITIEISFFIVNDCDITYDVVIGRDVLADASLIVITDQNEAKLVRKQNYNCCINESSLLPFSVDAIVTDLSDSAPLLELLHEFDSMITTGNAVSTVTTGSLVIRLKDESIINYHPYRLAPVERERVCIIIQDLLDHQIMRPSSSPFASPVVLVHKKDGSDRLCVDFRALNRQTIKDRYPLPLIDDQLDRLSGHRYYTSLDMAAGFHQIPIDPSSIEKTAFVTPDGHWEYLKMPFGLANAPSVFQRAINTALGNLRNTIALIYLDDILISSKTISEGLDSLRQVLTALKAAGFSLNIRKCRFLVQRIEYLGREISSEGIRPSSVKVNALLHAPVPTTVKEVRQFLGLAGYFRRFMPNFAQRTACLTKLTRKNEPWQWNAEHDEARHFIISHLTTKPLLVIFDPKLPTELHTDASSIGYGAVLFQKLNGLNRVVAYFSKRTTPEESRYHSYELETLAVVNALKHFRVYLLGVPFTLVTDCNAIKSSASKKDLLPRIARWWLYLQDFNFDIVFRKGSSISHADYFSRNPPKQILNVTRKTWIELEQHSDKEVTDLIAKLSTNNLDRKQYRVKNNLLYHVDSVTGGLQWYVPRGSRLGILKLFHDDQCHVGIEKTYTSILKYFWFPRLRQFVGKYIKHCLQCQLKKAHSGPKQGYLHPIDKVPVPFHTIHLDCLGPLKPTKNNEQHLLILVDAFTKFCMLMPLTRLTATETVEKFQQFLGIFGTPSRVILDSAPNFKNTELQTLLDACLLEYHFITPGVSRANGQVERYVQTISNLLRAITTVESEWTSQLWRLQLTLNTTVQKSTGFSPLRLLLGMDAHLPSTRALLDTLDLLPVSFNDAQPALIQAAAAKLKKHGAASARRFDAKRVDTLPITIGCAVLAHNKSQRKPRLSNHHTGPYKVLEILPGDRYKVQSYAVKPKSFIFAKEQLRLWPRQWTSPDIEALLDEPESDAEYTESDDEPLARFLSKT